MNMETTENLPSDDELSFLSELQRLEKVISEDYSFSSREKGCPVGNGEGGAMPSEERKQRKIVYKVTLQPRLSESAHGPEIPPQYLELFEKLQPRIIARGLASDSESLRTLNRSLQPKMAQSAVSSINKQTLLKSPVTEREAPLRVLGGRRMPPEALAAERQLAPWSVRNRGSLRLPTTPYNTGWTSSETSRSMTLPSHGVYGIREYERRPSFGAQTGRNTLHLGSAERPHSASRAQTERVLRRRSFCDDGEDDGSGGRTPDLLFSPHNDSSYKNYSQQIFRNARKLTSFSSEEEPEEPEFLRQLIGQRPGLLRSISVDFSGVKRDQGSWPTPPASVFNSPPASCATISSADEEVFLRNSLLLRGMKRFGSMQGLEHTDPSVTTSSSEVANDRSFLSDDPLAPTSSFHRMKAPLSNSSASSGFSSAVTGFSSGCDFHPAVSACYENTGTGNGTKVETNSDTDAFNSSSGVDLLFHAIARLSGHPETQLKHEPSSVPTEQAYTSSVVQPGRAASNTYNDEVDLSSSMSISADTEWSELTDESSTNAEHSWTAVDLSNCKEDGEPRQNSSSTQSEQGSTRSDTSFSNDDGQMEEDEGRNGYMPEVSSKFVSKVTVLLRRPVEEPSQSPVATSSAGACRIQQLPMRQLKPLQEWTH